MRAIFAAIARALRGIFGILWMPFEAIGSIFSGFGGGGGGSSQDRADQVATTAASEEAAKDMQLTADKPVTMDEVNTIKRVCGRLLMGKSISPETRISPALLDVLVNAPKGVLRNLADSDADAVGEFCDGLVKARAANSGVSEVAVDACFPNLTSRIADYRARENPRTTDRPIGQPWESLGRRAA